MARAFRRSSRSARAAHSAPALASRALQDAERERLVAVVDDPDLRRALIRRNIAERAVPKPVVQFTRHARRDEHVHPVLRRDQVRCARRLFMSVRPGAGEIRSIVLPGALIGRSGWLRARAAHTAWAFRRDFSFVDRFENRAARLVQVMAVVEAAFAEIRPEVGERALEPPLRQVMQPELLKARRIDQRTAARQRIEPRERGGGGRC